MKYNVAEYNGGSKLHLIEKELPKLKANDVLIKVQSATICGTDLQILNGNYDSSLPVILGHEFAGAVENKGDKVESLEVGDVVTVEPHLYCGLCKYCRIGKEHLCLDKKAFGVHLDGGFAEYCIVPEKITYKLPQGISTIEAALTENIGCCLHGIDRANIKLGDEVVILGGGFVGIILAELARIRGASTIIIVEPNEDRLNVIKQRGFTAINPINTDVNSVVSELTNGLGADIVIEAAGRKETAKQCFDLVGRGGNILIFGVIAPHEQIDISPNDIYKRELNIIGSAINPFSHHRSINLLKSLNLKELVTHHFPLDEIDKAFQTAAKGIGIKVAIHPNGDPYA